MGIYFWVVKISNIFWGAWNSWYFLGVKGRCTARAYVCRKTESTPLGWLCHARIQEFSSGGPGQLDKKSLTSFFFFLLFFFLVLSLFYSSQMVKFKEIYHFSRFQRGSNIFQVGGGPTFSRGRGSNCLFPIETHITCDFPGGVRTPCPPSGSALVCSWLGPAPFFGRRWGLIYTRAGDYYFS